MWTRAFLIVVRNERLWPREERSHLPSAFLLLYHVDSLVGVSINRAIPRWLFVHPVFIQQTWRENVWKSREGNGTMYSPKSHPPGLESGSGKLSVKQELRHFDQNKAREVRTQNSAGLREINRLLDESARCFFWGSFSAQIILFLNKVKQGIEISLYGDLGIPVIISFPFRAKIYCLSHGKLLLW